MQSKIKIAHLTSVHQRYDTRIFIKECSSAAKKFQTYLIVADGKGNEVKNNVSLIDVGQPENRFNRVFSTTKKIFQEAIKINADIYHLHDPELIPIGKKLKRLNKKVIFDAHEDLPKQILSKQYIKKPFRKLLSKASAIYENYELKKFDAIITATPQIKHKFSKINHSTIDINNFPIFTEFNSNQSNQPKKLNQICYIGGYSTARGIIEAIEAINLCSESTRLFLAGKYIEGSLEQKLHSLPGWEKTKDLGWLGREQISTLLDSSRIGLVTLHPTESYIESLPVKMFEYMAAGLPVIASNFPLWEDIVLSSNCGICVNPQAPDEIANAIMYLMENPAIAEQLGNNGKNAIINKYNWALEENKLMSLYQQII